MSRPKAYDQFSDEGILENGRLLPTNRNDALVEKISNNVIRIKYNQTGCSHVEIIETTSTIVNAKINLRGNNEITGQFTLVGDQIGYFSFKY